ncbi:MAG TPA: hypothetical protein VIM11_26210 [Tepidisphaeraceae bacterium]
MSPTYRSIAHLVCVLVLGVCGCTNQPAANPPSTKQSNAVSPKDPPRVVDWTKLPKSGAYFDVDSCADRLHSIEGQIISYYAVHRELPERLSDLTRYADPGDTTDYTCPVSHQSYVYVPNGLALANDVSNGRLILYDATPAHDSARGPMRWGILFSEAKGRAPVTTHIIPIPENTMPGFVPVAPRLGPTVPAPINPPANGQQ